MDSSVIFQMDAPFRTPIQIRRFRFGQPRVGKHLAIVSGMHGNETGGVLAVNQLIQFLQTVEVIGCIDIYPVVNPVGIDQSSKLNPLDHRDINRCFPGLANGTISERIAEVIFRATVDCSRVLSVHTGAAHVNDLTQVRCVDSEGDLFQNVDVPLLWKKSQLDGRIGLLGQCQQRGQQVLYCTSGSGNSVDLNAVNMQCQVLKSILHELDFITWLNEIEDRPQVFEGSMIEHRSTAGGFFHPQVAVGDRVEKGQQLGCVTEINGGEVLETIVAETTGMIASIRVNPVVHHRELLIKMVETSS